MIELWCSFLLYVVSNFPFSYTHIAGNREIEQGNGKQKIGQRKERQGKEKNPQNGFQGCLKFLEQVLYDKETSFYRHVYN